MMDFDDFFTALDEVLDAPMPGHCEGLELDADTNTETEIEIVQ